MQIWKQRSYNKKTPALYIVMPSLCHCDALDFQKRKEWGQRSYTDQCHWSQCQDSSWDRASPVSQADRQIHASWGQHLPSALGPQHHQQNPLDALTVKNLPAMRDTRVQSLGWEDPLEEGLATHSSILACRIPMDRSPMGYNPWGSQRVTHD